MERLVLSKSRIFCITAPMLVLFLTGGSLKGELCDLNPNPALPDLALIAYCSPGGADSNGVGGVMRATLCGSGNFNSVTLIGVDDSSPQPTAASLGQNGAGYECAVVLTEAPIGTVCTNDPSMNTPPDHVLDTASFELAQFVNNGGGVALIGGAMSPVLAFGAYRAEGLGESPTLDDMLDPGFSPYVRGIDQGATFGGVLLSLNSPAPVCSSLLNGVDSGDFDALTVLQAGPHLNGTATDCAQFGNRPGGVDPTGGMAINENQTVVGFPANPLDELEDGDSPFFEQLLKNAAFVVCQPKDDTIEVHLDVRPGTCPNAFNPDSNGKLPVALLGSADINVSHIDVNSLVMFGVPAEANHTFSDTGTPFTGVDPENPNFNDCTSAGADGFVDLNLKFPFPEIALALTAHEEAQLLKDTAHIITVTGAFNAGPNAGKSFIAHDVVRIVKDGPPFPLP